MKPFLDGSDKVVFIQRLREQCHNVGLFYVLELCDSVMRFTHNFFELPLQEKMSMDYRKSPQFRGYMRLGVENTDGLVDYREQVELGPDQEAEFEIVDGKPNFCLYPVWRRLRGPNQWLREEILPDFRHTLENFIMEMISFSMKLMAALALSLGLSEDYFEPTFGFNPHYQMKLARYPPIAMPREENRNMLFGVGAHSDSGFLSLLLQDDVGGLQAKLHTGEWIDVPPQPGTLVVNLGEMLQLATNGYYLATIHRVNAPQGNRPRYSIPFFFNPRLDVEVHGAAFPMNTTVQASNFITHGGRNELLPVFGDNTFKSFARSHPAVVQSHHKDLVQDYFV